MKRAFLITLGLLLCALIVGPQPGLACAVADPGCGSNLRPDLDKLLQVASAQPSFAFMGVPKAVNPGAGPVAMGIAGVLLA